jgi:hypothetical protein
VRVTGTVAPGAPNAGAIVLSVGGGGLTVKTTGALVPALVVTVTFAAPSVALAAMVNVAVICVVLTTVTALTAIPVLLVAAVAPATKLVPVRVTGIAAPRTPVAAAMVLSVGGGGLTVKTTGALVPPLVVTVTFAAPSVALAAMVNVAVICVVLTTVTALTAIPVLLVATVAPETKLVPVRVTGAPAPRTPVAGAMVLSVGGGGLTVKMAGALVPPLVVTVTFAPPSVALAAMVNVAVIRVALTTVKALTAMPGLLVVTVAPRIKFVPVRVTGTLVPWTPLVGPTDASVGAGFSVTMAEAPLLVSATLVAVTVTICWLVTLAGAV